MPAQAVLTIVVVHDAELRSALAARLAGAEIQTWSTLLPDEPRPRRFMRQPTILVADESGLAGALAQQIEREWIEGRWRRVVTLTIDAPASTGTGSRIGRAARSEALSALFEDWRDLIDPAPENTGEAYIQNNI